MIRKTFSLSLLLVASEVFTASAYHQNQATCNGHQCEPGSVCILQSVQCFRAPCPPIPTCVPGQQPPTCAAVTCLRGTRCEIVNGQAQCLPTVSPRPTCATVRCSSGTVCEIQNGFPECVPTLTCANILCVRGTRCQIIDGQPQCVPSVPPRPTCATVRCSSGTQCEIQNGTPRCVPTLTCANILCTRGTRCRMINGQPECVPDSRPTCANVRCPGNSICRIVRGQPQCVRGGGGTGGGTCRLRDVCRRQTTWQGCRSASSSSCCSWYRNRCSARRNRGRCYPWQQVPCANNSNSGNSNDLACPSPGNSIGICVELCSGDESCPGDQLCCSNGCGSVCRNGVPA